MSELKYVITDKGDFAIFTKLTNHSDIRGLHGKIVGAGFCNFAIGYAPIGTYKLGEEQRCVNIHCYGKSESLGIGSREEDEVIINKKLNQTS